jgi:microcin C transport system permease protein
MGPRYGPANPNRSQLITYTFRRLLFMIPTLLGIMIVNFVIVQTAPGGPVEVMIARIRGHGAEATARVGGSVGGEVTGGREAPTASGEARYRGARGIDPDLIRQLEKQYGFDRPATERFVLMLGNYVRFDFGQSFFRDRRVIDLVIEKLPVSISLGLWTTLLIYLVSIPLGVAKAVRDGSSFDVWTSGVVIVGYAIPGFLFAIMLIVLFAGGSFFAWFPLRGLVSDQWATLAWPARIADYFWHIALPVTALVVGGFAGLTMLTKNSFLEEIGKQYVVTARAKGLGKRRVLYGHVFRNAMLLVVAGFPAAFVGILFTGALLIEVIFSLDGLGLLGFEAAINRDYPIMFGTLYIYTLIGLLLGLISDLTYAVIDPRIDFARREH